MSFSAWITEVDRVIGMFCGLDSNDLPDIDYNTLFEDEVQPADAAELALENAGWDFD